MIVVVVSRGIRWCGNGGDIIGLCCGGGGDCGGGGGGVASGVEILRSFSM